VSGAHVLDELALRPDVHDASEHNISRNGNAPLAKGNGECRRSTPSRRPGAVNTPPPARSWINQIGQKRGAGDYIIHHARRTCGPIRRRCRSRPGPPSFIIVARDCRALTRFALLMNVGSRSATENSRPRCTRERLDERPLTGIVGRESAHRRRCLRLRRLAGPSTLATLSSKVPEQDTRLPHCVALRDELAWPVSPPVACVHDRMPSNEGNTQH